MFPLMVLNVIMSFPNGPDDEEAGAEPGFNVSGYVPEEADSAERERYPEETAENKHWPIGFTMFHFLSFLCFWL